MNIGEEICGEWLRHFRKCEFVQYNLKTPDIQGEIDVIGINLSDHIVYVCEVAIHLVTGLRYKDNVPRLTTKFRKAVEYIEKAFPKYKHVFMLWSPVVRNPKKTGSKCNQVDDIQQIVESIKKECGVIIRPVINEKFQEKLVALRQSAKETSAALDSSVMRFLQVEEHLKLHLNQGKGVHPPLDSVPDDDPIGNVFKRKYNNLSSWLSKNKGHELEKKRRTALEKHKKAWNKYKQNGTKPKPVGGGVAKSKSAHGVGKSHEQSGSTGGSGKATGGKSHAGTGASGGGAKGAKGLNAVQVDDHWITLSDGQHVLVKAGVPIGEAIHDHFQKKIASGASWQSKNKNHPDEAMKKLKAQELKGHKKQYADWKAGKNAIVREKASPKMSKAQLEAAKVSSTPILMDGRPGLIIKRFRLEDIPCIDDEENADWIKRPEDVAELHRLMAEMHKRNKPVSFEDALPNELTVEH